MRRLYRRDKRQIAFAVFVGAIGVVTTMSFLILYLPSRSEYVEVGETITRLQREIEVREFVLQGLEDTGVQLDDARTERMRFLAARLIPRDEGFAAMIPDMERLAQLAGISRDRVSYGFSEEPEFGLHPVPISMPLLGGYTDLTQFIEELESAETFFILDSIQLNRSQDEEQEQVNMALNLTTFFSYQP